MPKQRESPVRSPSSRREAAAPYRSAPGSRGGHSVGPLNIQALSAFEDEFLQSPSVAPVHAAGAHSPAAKKPMSAAAALDLCASTCNFNDFSRHFHLPLKAAAEKFGVRATAFKKRCRAIGIRHWPYRKVRSLKRSLQELSRAQEEAETGGGLTDKQRRQLSTFQKQLGTLLSPETYGIDSSGRLSLPTTFDDGDNDVDDSQLEDDDADSDVGCSPRPGPAEALDFGSSFRAAADANREMMLAMASAPSHLRSFRRQTAYHDPNLLAAATYSASLYAVPAMASAGSASSKLVFGWPDCYYFNEEAMALTGRVGDGAAATAAKSDAASASSDEQDTERGSPADSSANSPVASGEGQQDASDFFTPDVKFEEVRSLRGDIADDAAFAEPAGGHIDYTSERFFDDVFLQISPDYGCLV